MRDDHDSVAVHTTSTNLAQDLILARQVQIFVMNDVWLRIPDVQHDFDGRASSAGCGAQDQIGDQVIFNHPVGHPRRILASSAVEWPFMIRQRRIGPITLCMAHKNQGEVFVGKVVCRFFDHGVTFIVRATLLKTFSHLK